ncbi:MAG: aminoglycoside phosphotransferase family protein [Gordonia sp. (in: high G+C Gram-positive bacteria)]|uniref:aminoglycoside phosphotransferase family protein n=1 Tax=Gordonia sp. (in: high G+C Gram-positive bacteria) TaxID=84139 RepID=UPI0039E537A3
MAIPDGLQAQRRLGPDWADWLDRLPRLVETLLREWELTVTGPPMHGFASIVVPVVVSNAPTTALADGGAAVLKIGFDGADDTAQEPLALQLWDGDGAVRMYRAAPARRAMLLERLGSENLNGEEDVQACEIVAGFYPRLHVPAPPRLRRLSDVLTGWLDDMAADAAAMPVPRRMVDQALSLGRDFAADPDCDGKVVHGDLHYENVLSADRAPWLVIDPQPMSGDPHYEPAPLLWNRWDEMDGYLRESIRRRLHTVVDVAGLDADRARDWVTVRMVVNAHWSVEDARRMHRPLDASERDWITRCVSIVKAVQD